MAKKEIGTDSWLYDLLNRPVLNWILKAEYYKSNRCIWYSNNGPIIQQF